MSANIRQICEWIMEIVDEKPDSFSDYYLEDIYTFLKLDTFEMNFENAKAEKSLKKICNSKYESLIACSSKDEVRKWLHKITSFIVMKNNIEDIIYDFFDE